VQSDWVPPSPSEINMPPQVYGAQSSANISDRLVGF